MENLEIINELTVGYAKCIAEQNNLLIKKGLLKYVKSGDEEELIKLNGYFMSCVNLLKEISKSIRFVIKNSQDLSDGSLKGYIFDIKTKAKVLKEKLHDKYFNALAKKYESKVDLEKLDL